MRTRPPTVPDGLEGVFLADPATENLVQGPSATLGEIASAHRDEIDIVQDLRYLPTCTPGLMRAVNSRTMKFVAFADEQWPDDIGQHAKGDNILGECGCIIHRLRCRREYDAVSLLLCQGDID
jgi:hypothetical protein